MPIRTVNYALMAGLALLVAAGCAGGIETGRQDGTPGWTPKYSPPYNPNDPSNQTTSGQLDTGTPPPSTTPDGGSQQPAPDATATPAPDTAPYQPPQNPYVGQACPCQGGTVCVNSKCRATCSKPVDACKAVSNCRTDEGCVATLLGPHVCLPALAKGAACNTSVPCPVKTICASVNNSPYTCLPVCSSAGASCGSGGTCLKHTNGCMFCSKP